MLIRALVHDSREMALSPVLLLTSHLCFSFHLVPCVFRLCFFVLGPDCWRACIHSGPWLGTADTFVIKPNNL